MLIEHRVDDVNECFVAIEKTMPSSQQITFQPTLADVFAQHLDNPTGPGEMHVVRLKLFHPVPIGRLKHGIQAVG